MSEKGPAV